MCMRQPRRALPSVQCKAPRHRQSRTRRRSSVLFTARAAVFTKAFFFDHFDCGKRNSAGKGAASESAGMNHRVFAKKRVPNFRRAQERAYRHDSAAQTFSEGCDIGHHLLMIHSEHIAGSREACLNLIQNENDAAFVTNLSDLAQVAFGRNMNSAFSLNRFNDHGTDRTVYRFFNGRGVAKLNELYAGKQRLERLLKLFAPC